jgi:peptide/nickel transport system ATP-binding protein
MTIMQLHRPTAGRVLFGGTDLASLTDKKMRAFRRLLQIVFQDPYSLLNPRMTVDEALVEPIVYHGRTAKTEASMPIP